MNNDIEPFDDLQCEDLYAGSPEPEPLTEAELEQQWQDWAKANPEEAAKFELFNQFIESLNQ